MTSLTEELRMVSNMIHMGERIQYGRETTLMHKAADEIEHLQALAQAEAAVVGDWEVEFDEKFCTTVNGGNVVVARWLKTPVDSESNFIFTKSMKDFITASIAQAGLVAIKRYQELIQEELDQQLTKAKIEAVAEERARVEVALGDWEAEFDSKYIKGDFGITLCDPKVVPFKSLKAFITNLLAAKDREVARASARKEREKVEQVYSELEEGK